MPTPESDRQNIVLTGFMGTGKTTAGRLVAERLGMEFVDTDEVIESRHGPIPEIFRVRGEAAFRAIEREVARELSARTGLVISTGGRMMLDPENISTLGSTGRVFCLVATPDEIYERVSAGDGSAERPLLSVADPRERIRELLAERDAGYRRFPQVSTSGRSAHRVARDLVALAESSDDS